MRYDVMIIGGGPGGYTAAGHAGKAGLKTVLFEKDKLGGTCLNRGCIPMKALIEAAHKYRDGISAAHYGLSIKDIGYDVSAINSFRNNIVDTLRNGIEKQLKAAKVEIVKGQARIIGNNSISCGGEIYEGDRIVIAAGSTVARPPIRGVEHTISSDDVLEGDFVFPKTMTIIGGGVIGVEIADALSAFGTKITIIELTDRLLPTMDKDLGQRMAMFFKKKGIEVILSARVEEIVEADDVLTVRYLDKNGEMKEVASEKVLLATGRRANVDGLAQGFDLEMNRGVVADENGVTSHGNIYVIGDARSGNIQLAHVAENQGENVIDLILGKKQNNDLSVIPSGVYTDPEIASVGASETELKEKGIEYVTKKFLTGANGKCLIENSESGFVKLLAVDDVIVGGQIIAPHATELIGEIAIAVQKKMCLKGFAETVHPHPTISEMISGAAKL